MIDTLTFGLLQALVGWALVWLGLGWVGGRYLTNPTTGLTDHTSTTPIPHTERAVPQGAHDRLPGGLPLVLLPDLLALPREEPVVLPHLSKGCKAVCECGGGAVETAAAAPADGNGRAARGARREARARTVCACVKQNRTDS